MGSALGFRKFSEENLTKDFIRSPVGRIFLPQRLNKYHGVQKDAEHGRYHADGKPGDGKAFAPLKKYLSLPKDDPERAAHMDSALRVACFIPTEILYTAARTAELLSELAGKGVKGAISDVGVGLELCRAAMRASRLNILINAAGMADEVFAMTLRRECELVFEQYGPVIDSGLAAVEARIG